MFKYEATKPKDPKGFLEAIDVVLRPTPSCKPRTLFIFDTETTGITPRDCIIELGCVEFMDGALTGRNFHRLCKPYMPIHHRASAVHGITMDMLRDEPPVDLALSEFFKYMRDTREAYALRILNKAMASLSIAKAHKMKALDAAHGPAPPVPANTNTSNDFALCGHNVAFDIRMLEGNAAHFGLDKAPTIRADEDGGLGHGGLGINASAMPSLCTMALFKKLYPGQSSNTLDSCCRFFGIERNMSPAERTQIGDFRMKSSATQHSALTDAHATGLLLTAMIDQAKKHADLGLGEDVRSLAATGNSERSLLAASVASLTAPVFADDETDAS